MRGVGPAHGGPGGNQSAERLTRGDFGSATAVTSPGSVGIFVKLIGHPQVMRLAVRHGMAAPDS